MTLRFAPVIDIRNPYEPKEVGRWQTEQTEIGRYVHDVMAVDGVGPSLTE